ncbi:MAG: hypothetical protein FWH03_03550 [Firmicutes bacterium]|nr:hypothetical protein [Bacillota bacterium]
MDKDFLKEIENLVEETELEMKGKSAPSAKQSGKPRPKLKHPHAGHRGRMKQSADSDPDFMVFSDIEMLEYLLFNTIPRVDTNVLSHLLIDTFGSFSGVLNANVNELKAYVTEETARMLTSILPAARKAEIARLRNNTFIRNTTEAVRFLAPYFMNRSKEYIYLACINNSERVINIDLVAVGDTNFSAVEIKKIVETACRHKATNVVIAHNHPSGNLSPSEEDLHLTSRLNIALLSINIKLLDHVIFSSEGYYSLFANRDFEAIYAQADKIFNTNFLQEIRLKPKNYREGIYPSGRDELFEDAALPIYDDDREKMSYSLGHPDLRNFKIKKP